MYEHETTVRYRPIAVKRKGTLFYLEQNTLLPLDLSKSRHRLMTYFKVIKDNKMPETKFMNKMKINYTWV
jgi:hypothetical protein